MNIHIKDQRISIFKINSDSLRPSKLLLEINIRLGLKKIKKNIVFGTKKTEIGFLKKQHQNHFEHSNQYCDNDNQNQKCERQRGNENQPQENQNWGFQNLQLTHCDDRNPVAGTQSK